ncbi:hypothetical protein ABT403_28615 [Streptomyces sp. NPDC000075]|uniref:hypothetical protein n=1 Tax=Streptomyces TaxID=1883 RepID=UPI0031D35B48
MPPTTTVLRPLGTPLPIGFLGLAAAAFVVSAVQLGWIPPHERHAVALVLVAFAFPLQLLAALIGFRVRDTAFATAMALEDTRGRPVLPVGRHGSGARAVEEGAEPGVRPLL